jgi:septum formation inhibitor-activating ATPase MinD
LTITITIGGVHKGGVGKTTAAITIGHGLALAGYTVLIEIWMPKGTSPITWAWSGGQ